MNAEGTGDLADGFTFFEQPLRQLLWSSFIFFLTTEANSALLRIDPASAGPFSTEVALERGDAGEDGHDHLAGMGGGIGPRLGDGLNRAPAELAEADSMACGSKESTIRPASGFGDVDRVGSSEYE